MGSDCTAAPSSPMNCAMLNHALNPSRMWTRAGFVFAICMFSTIACSQTFTTLASFVYTNGGQPGHVFLVQGLDGNLYGTSQIGGTHSTGNVFKMSPTSGVITTIYSFCSQSSCTDGYMPWAGLAMSSSGVFYGVTSAGGIGDGTVFKITSSGTLTTLHTFDGSDGSNARDGLVLATNSNFYGTTINGGSAGNGSLYEITPAGAFTLLDSFGPTGSSPEGRLVQGTNGLFYGTARYGNVFDITSAGTLTQLHAFSGGTDGSDPVGPLVQGTDGNFYGGDVSGANGDGVIYKITSAGAFTTVYTFCSLANCADGGSPYQGVIQATDGNFYGMTMVGGAYKNGTIFQLTPSGNLTTLYSFCKIPGCPDGTTLYGGLLQATDGNLYGTTFGGGTQGVGTVFRLSMGLPPFVHPVTVAGKVGATVVLLGTNLAGATAVDFNGTAGTIAKLNKTWLRTTVPAGATTGPITVTTPAGTLTSDLNYRVLP